MKKLTPSYFKMIRKTLDEIEDDLLKKIEKFIMTPNIRVLQILDIYLRKIKIGMKIIID